MVDASEEACIPLTLERGRPRALELRTDVDVGTREVLGERIEGGVVPPFREPIAAADSKGHRENVLSGHSGRQLT